MHLKVSAPSLMWVGLATGHIIMYDVTTFIPLMATRRHENPVRAMQTVKTTGENWGYFTIVTVQKTNQQ